MKNQTLIGVAIVAVIITTLWTCEKSPEIIERTVHDTVTIVKDSIIIKEKEVPIYVHDTVYQPTVVYRDTSSTGEVTSVYQDTSHIEENFYLFYTANVAGSLNWINMGYYDNRPDSVEIRTVTNNITTTNYISPKGIYFGGQISTSGDITPAGMYQWKSNAVIGGYNIQDKSVVVGYFRKF